jgi:hypothetical protein
MIKKRCTYAAPFVILFLFFILFLSSCKMQTLPDEEPAVTETVETEEEAGENNKDIETAGDEPVIEEIEVEKPVPEEPEQPEEKNIRVMNPEPNQVISSPLVISGEARGTWFFEADFPVILRDGDGNVIAEHYAQALSDWMTGEFVPFEAVIEFEKPATEIGYLILEKDNPSGLEEHDEESLIIPVRFK